MSETLEPGFAPWDAGNETGGAAAANERQFAALRTAIGYAEEFTLLIALCDRNDLRRETMRRIRAELSGIPFLDIPLTAPVENLYHTLREQLAKPDSHGAKAVMAWGLEVWLPAGLDAENSPFVKNLNAARNHFPGVLRGPLILWLSTHHLDAIARGAPDFWSVRSGVYVFAAAREERQAAAETLQSLGLTGAAGLTYEEKLRRAEELEDMLADLQKQPESERDLARVLRLLDAVVETYLLLAKYDLAEPLLRHQLEVVEKNLGPNDMFVAAKLADLALLLSRTNRLAEAEPLLRRSLDIAERSLGPNHPDVATGLDNLARVLLDANRLAEAEPLLRRSLEIGEESLGPNHWSVATGLDNLGAFLRLTHRYTEAEPLLRRALKISEESLGPNHPIVAISLSNLALLLRRVNRLAEAESLLRRALDIDEKSLGPNHPDVATVLRGLARIEQDKGNPREARRLLERALNIDRDSLGADHPNTISTLRRLTELDRETEDSGS